jgi:hypothetical protein
MSIGMTQKRALIIGGLLAIFVVIAGVIVFTVNAPKTSTVVLEDCISAEQSDECIRFPKITGANLLGDELVMPEDFMGAYTLVVVPFDEDQQTGAEEWLPLARELTETYADFTYYNVAVFPADIAAPIRSFIRLGMNVAITDDALKAVTITAFLDDRDSFLAALRIPDVDSIQLFLLNRDREIIWRESGGYTSSKGESLRQAVISRVESQDETR